MSFSESGPFLSRLDSEPPATYSNNMNKYRSVVDVPKYLNDYLNKIFFFFTS